MIAIPQVDGDGFTAGKPYRATHAGSWPCNAFRTRDNKGAPAYCLEFGCAHLAGGDWLLTSAPIEPDPKNTRPNNVRRRRK